MPVIDLDFPCAPFRSSKGSSRSFTPPAAAFVRFFRMKGETGNSPLAAPGNFINMTLLMLAAVTIGVLLVVAILALRILLQPRREEEGLSRFLCGLPFLSPSVDAVYRNANHCDRKQRHYQDNQTTNDHEEPSESSFEGLHPIHAWGRERWLGCSQTHRYE